VGTDTEQKTQVNAKSTDVGTSLAADPEDTKLPLIVEFVELALVNGTDTELALDGGDERGTLEERTGEGLEGACKLSLATGEFIVQADDADVLLTSTLLGLDKTCSTVNADNQTSSDLGVKSTGVTSLLNTATTLASCLIIRGDSDPYRSMRLIHDTTSWEEGFEGLSRLMTPDEMYDLMSRARGAHPCGMGV
jgi:hypothetical protein